MSSRNLKMRRRRRELPFELVVEILARVPVKDLIRFRCVCKTWRSLFREEWFHRQHMTHAPTKIMSFGRLDKLLCRFSNDNGGKPEMIVQENLLNVRDERLILDAALVGHCHGLFCFCFDYHTFGVWNPSLRELRKIRTPAVSYGWSEMGFGYDPSSKDYKIVLLLEKRGGSHAEAAVFSLKSGASRMIEFRDIGMLHSRLPGTLVGENIYWQVYDDDVQVTDKFLGFNLVSETFKFYPGPSYCGGNFPQVIAGGLKGGGLCTVGVDDPSGGLIVCSAQHDDKIGGGGGITSWSKICILSRRILEISTSCRIDSIFLLSAITYAGLLLVLVDIDIKESTEKETKLLAYNLEEKSLTNVETSLSNGFLTYVETLVPIPGRLRASAMVYSSWESFGILN